MSRRGAILRATGMLGAITALAVGATFALANNQTELTNANLIVSPNLNVAADCLTFAQTDSTAINFNGLVEGQNFKTNNAKPFCLKDISGSNLAVSVQADLSAVTSTGSIDASKVGVRFVDTSNSNTTTDTTLQALESGPVALHGLNGVTRLAPGVAEHMTVNLKLNSGAVTGSASLSNLGLIFNGS